MRLLDAFVSMAAGSARKYVRGDDARGDEDARSSSADNGAAEQAALVVAIRKAVLRMNMPRKSTLLENNKTSNVDLGSIDVVPAVVAASESDLISAALSDVFQCFLMRRTKESVNLGLPPKTRIIQCTVSGIACMWLAKCPV